MGLFLKGLAGVAIPQATLQTAARWRALIRCGRRRWWRRCRSGILRHRFASRQVADNLLISGAERSSGSVTILPSLRNVTSPSISRTNSARIVRPVGIGPDAICRDGLGNRGQRHQQGEPKTRKHREILVASEMETSLPELAKSTP